MGRGSILGSEWRQRKAPKNQKFAKATGINWQKEGLIANPGKGINFGLRAEAITLVGTLRKWLALFPSLGGALKHNHLQLFSQRLRIGNNKLTHQSDQTNPKPKQATLQIRGKSRTSIFTPGLFRMEVWPIPNATQGKDLQPKGHGPSLRGPRQLPLQSASPQ